MGSASTKTGRTAKDFEQNASKYHIWSWRLYRCVACNHAHGYAFIMNEVWKENGCQCDRRCATRSSWGAVADEYAMLISKDPQKKLEFDRHWSFAQDKN